MSSDLHELVKQSYRKNNIDYENEILNTCLFENNKNDNEVCKTKLSSFIKTAYIDNSISSVKGVVLLDPTSAIYAQEIEHWYYSLHVCIIVLTTIKPKLYEVVSKRGGLNKRLSLENITLIDKHCLIFNWLEQRREEESFKLYDATRFIAVKKWYLDNTSSKAFDYSQKINLLMEEKRIKDKKSNNGTS